MVTRIRQLLEQKQLTPTQFADAIGVGRPVMSHILSERNKPSLEVVQRIIEAFPDVSMSWLLKGVGNMLEGDVKAHVAAAANIPSAPTQPEASAAALPTELPATPADQSVPVVPPLLAAPAATAAAVISPEPTEKATTREQEAEVLPTPVPTVPIPPVLVAPVVASAQSERAAVPSAPAPKPFAASRFVRPSSSPPLVVQPTISPAPVVAPSAPVTTAAPSPMGPAPFIPATSPVPKASVDTAAPSTLATPAALAEPNSTTPETGFFPFLNESGKAIRRIVIFYRDGSFADYQPEQ